MVWWVMGKGLSIFLYLRWRGQETAVVGRVRRVSYSYLITVKVN